MVGQNAAQGIATNEGLQNQYRANPGLVLSKIGRQGITHMLQGQVDAKTIPVKEWDDYASGTSPDSGGIQHGPAEFGAWMQKFNKNFNPLVLQYARMTPDERTSFRSTLTPKAQQNLAVQIPQYSQKGWIDMTGQGNGP